MAEIISHCHQERTMSNISLLNKDCLHEASNYLWREVSLRPEYDGQFDINKLDEVLSMLSKNAQFIQTLEFTIAPTSPESCDRLCQVLQHMPNLRHLVVKPNAYRSRRSMARSLSAYGLPFRLKSFVCEHSMLPDLLPFLHLQPDIERFQPEPQSGSIIASTIVPLSLPSSLLPRLRSVTYVAMGLADLTKDRHVESVTTTLLPIEEAAFFTHALSLSLSPIRHIRLQISVKILMCTPIVEALSQLPALSVLEILPIFTSRGSFPSMQLAKYPSLQRFVITDLEASLVDEYILEPDLCGVTLREIRVSGSTTISRSPRRRVFSRVSPTTWTHESSGKEGLGAIEVGYSKIPQVRLINKTFFSGRLVWDIVRYLQGRWQECYDRRHNVFYLRTRSRHVNGNLFGSGAFLGGFLVYFNRVNAIHSLVATC